MGLIVTLFFDEKEKCRQYVLLEITPRTADFLLMYLEECY